MICQHCQKSPVTRPRGLCWVCYYTPGVKGQYGPVSKYGRRGVGTIAKRTPTDGRLPTPLPDLVPGSEAKIAVMAERAARRESLFHPQELKHTTAIPAYEVPEVAVAEMEKR